MTSRRTWARIVFLGEILVLPFQLSRLRRATDEDGEPVPLSPRWLLAGMGLQVAYTWAYDRDIGDIRTKRLRSVLIAVLWGIVGFRAFPRSESVSRNLSIGGSFGEIAYRLWYGVLRPLPGDDE